MLPLTCPDTGLNSDSFITAQYAGPVPPRGIDDEFRLLKQQPAQVPQFPSRKRYAGQCLPLCIIQRFFQIIWKRGIAFSFFFFHETAPDTTISAKSFRLVADDWSHQCLSHVSNDCSGVSIGPKSYVLPGIRRLDKKWMLSVIDRDSRQTRYGPTVIPRSPAPPARHPRLPERRPRRDRRPAHR